MTLRKLLENTDNAEIIDTFLDVQGRFRYTQHYGFWSKWDFYNNVGLKCYLDCKARRIRADGKTQIFIEVHND